MQKKMTVTPEIDENGDAHINMDNFKEFLDIDKVKFYEVKSMDEGISIRFFDKDKKEIKPQEVK